MSNPVFSVIITTYNYGRYLGECIESVLSQTVSRDQVEIIVVDDGSTDGTSRVVAPYLQKGLIKYFLKPNGGHASALNFGFQNSCGSILVFLDADDVCLPHKLQAVKETYDKFLCGAVLHNVGISRDEGTQFKAYRDPSSMSMMERVSENVFRADMRRNPEEQEFLTVLSGQTYSREVCQKMFPIPEIFTRHTDLYLHGLAYVYTDVYFDLQILTRYRIHDMSHLAALRRQERSFLELQVRLEGEVFEEVRKRAFPNPPPGLLNLWNAWIVHRAELIVTQGREAEAIRFLWSSFCSKEFKVSWYRFLKTVIRIKFGPTSFSVLSGIYWATGIGHIRRWLNNIRKARKLRAVRKARRAVKV